MPSYTALDVVTRSLRETGYLSGTQTPSGQDGQSGLDTLNGMIDSMSIDGEFIYCRDISTYALTSGVQSYDIGPTAAAPFNVDRPKWIINANIVNSSGTRFPLAVVNDDARMKIAVPNIPSSLPGALNYRATSPNGVLWFYAKPTSGYSVELETWKQLDEFADLTTTADFPPGYYDMLVYGLAQRFTTPGWGREPSEQINTLYEKARARVAALNLWPTPSMLMDPRAAGVRAGDDMGVPQFWIDSIYPQSLYR